MHIALGIDIGGSFIRAAVVRVDTQSTPGAGGRVGTSILALAESPLPSEGDPLQIAQAVKKLAERVRIKAGCTTSVVCVALPGIWDRRTGLMQKAVNLPGLEGVNIQQLFEETLACPAMIEIDVNAASWGQWQWLSLQPRRFVYLSLGTGVGGGVILDGKLLRHTHEGAGHFGFLIVDTTPDAPSDASGIPGSLSALAAGSALRLAAADQSNQGIIDAGRALAIALVQLVYIYAPDTIALGGGVVDHHPAIVDHARAAFQSYYSRLIPNDPRIIRAPLVSAEAGVIGAALLALKHNSELLG